MTPMLKQRNRWRIARKRKGVTVIEYALVTFIVSLTAMNALDQVAVSMRADLEKLSCAVKGGIYRPQRVRDGVVRRAARCVVRRD
ncbi:MAG: hypothetical protein GDA50_04935 [Alphaproteobacteria bacterium GM202ARS2]|nr:hypothetical protein [Alphaproteobacteria bacterium GM202ARS2]